MAWAVGMAMAMPAWQQARQVPQKRKTAPQRVQAGDTVKRPEVKAQPILVEDDSIPDSLLHTRWRIQRTTAVTQADLRQHAADLRRPDNLKQEVAYNDTTHQYVIGTRLGNMWLATPIVMMPDE